MLVTLMLIGIFIWGAWSLFAWFILDLKEYDPTDFNKDKYPQHKCDCNCKCNH